MKNSLVFTLAFLTLLVYGSIGQQLGRPFIQTFPPSKYKSDGQNWQVNQDSRGMVFVRNNEVILEYDGVNWKQIPLNGTQFYNFTLDDRDILHVAIDNDFGYLTPDQNGGWEFHSLKKEIGYETIPLILRCYYANQKVFYMSRNIMYTFDTQTMKLDSLKPEDRFITGYVVEDNLIMRDGTNYKEWNGSGFDLLPFQDAFPTRTLITFIPKGNGKYILANSDDGFYNYDRNAKTKYSAVRKLKTDVDEFMKKNRMTFGIPLQNNTFAISTTAGGIVVINGEGNWLQWVNKKSGLMDDNIYYLHLDNQNGVWAAGIGLNRVELGSPISNWYDEVGGWVTAIGSHKGKVYAGAQGAYYLDSEGFKEVKGIPKSKRAWTFLNYHLPFKNDSILLMGVDDGMYEVKGDQATLVKEGTTAFKFVPSPSNPNMIYVANSNAVLAYVYNNGEWTENTQKRVDGFTGSVRSLAEDEKGNLWIGTYRRGVKYARFDTELKSPVIEDRSKGLPATEHVMVYSFDDRIYFASPKGIYEYSDTKEQFVPSPRYGHFFKEVNRESYIIHQAPNKELWVAGFKTNDQPIAKITRNDDGGYSWYDKAYKRLPAIEMEVILEDEKGVTWIGGSEGLFRFDNNVEREYEKPYKTYIRRITIGEDSVYFKGAFSNIEVNSSGDTIRTVRSGQPAGQKATFDYNNNSIAFTFAAPSFDNSEDANEYRYFLEGYQKHWSDWAKDTRQSYTNLSEGNYTFRVKARNAYGVESEEGTYAFKVLPPWYRTYWAYGSYAIFGGLFVFGLVRLNTRRLKQQNEKLEQTVQERTAEIAEQKEQIEKSYQNISTLSEIGQKITSALEFDALIQSVYQSVNQLMDAPSFGVGIHHEDQERLEFRGYIENGETLPTEYDYLKDDSKISVWCFKNKDVVFINNMEEDYFKYTKLEYRPKSENHSWSSIYLPLFVDDKVIGVITVQSPQKNAYTNQDLTMLQTLASYVSIAFANNQSFEVIKEKNDQITDSIRYAETIQTAVLPSKERMNEALHDYFVIWQPKDIVSGDFYWFNHVEDKIFLAVVDCTGHGVPGAFMSMIGNAILNEVVNVERVYSPAKILERMHYYVRKSLKQEEKKNMDGMDVGLLVMETIPNNLDDIRITFSGAKMPLFYVKNDELLEIKGDRKAIGGLQREEYRSFTNKELILHPGDCFYICSDGFVDQHNPEKRKIGTLRLKELLKVSISMEMKDQHEMLLNALLNHKRDAIQRDDITIIGVKV